MGRDLLIDRIFGIDDPGGGRQHGKKINPEYGRQKTKIFPEPGVIGDREDKDLNGEKKQDEMDGVVEHNLNHNEGIYS